MNRDRFCAVIVAAGRSSRTGDVDKLWAPLTGPDAKSRPVLAHTTAASRRAAGKSRPLLAYSIAAFQRAAVDRIALVVAEDAIERAQKLVKDEGFHKVVAVVAGGARRQDSVRAGLDALVDCEFVAVHDGARPLVTPELIERGLAAAQETGAACCAVPVADTLKESKGEYVVRTLDRSRLWLAQTPQVFRYDLLVDAHAKAQGEATDDAALVEALGVKVRLYEGSSRNVKVTTADDLVLAQALLSEKR